MSTPTTSSKSPSNPLSSVMSSSSSSPPEMDPSSTPIPRRFYTLRSWVSQPVIASFLAGGIAGAVSRTVVSPLERLKILLQVQSGARSEYKLGTWKALQKIWREEGMKGMLAGNGTNCIRIVPYSAVQFGSYNLYKPLVGLESAYCEVQITGKRVLMHIIRSSSNPHPAHLSLLHAASAAALSLG